MHDWFAAPLAAARAEQADRRATHHRLLVAAGADLRARASRPVLRGADRLCAALVRRRTDAGAGGVPQPRLPRPRHA